MATGAGAGAAMPDGIGAKYVSGEGGSCWNSCWSEDGWDELGVGGWAIEGERCCLSGWAFEGGAIPCG
jgi:hypothetical protein